MEREELIAKILELDMETYQGIDDPDFLYDMSTPDLEQYYKDMLDDLAN